MTKTQMMINEMYKGNVQKIMEGIDSNTPILVLNAIVAGTNRKMTREAFLAGVERATESDIVLLGVPLKSFAEASLHLLERKKYAGEDPVVIAMIENGLRF